MSEIWQPIPEIPRYFASSIGNIKGPRGVLSPTLRYETGYKVCQVAGKQWRVHRLICMAFYGLPPTVGHHAAHKNGKNGDNRVENLYWATPAENTADSVRLKVFLGENHPNCKLTEEDVIWIREQRKAGKSVTEIWAKLPKAVSKATVNHAAVGRNWGHVGK